MLQTYLTEPNNIQLSESPVPEPKNGEVLIRLTMVGICGSDIHMFKNGHRLDSPLTIGHEGIGVIEKVGEGVSSSRVGERVVIEPNVPCLHCPECWSGKGNVCRNKRIIGVNETGCFAEYICLPDNIIHKLPDSISELNAVAIEPTTVGLAALNRSKAKPGDTIAVIGLGAIGMLLTHIALSLGYKVLVAELVEDKIKKAVEMGAHYVKGGNSLKETAEIYETVFHDEEVAAVFECAGSEQSAALAIQSVPRGVDVILLGLSEEGSAFNPRLISRKGNHIIPSLIYDHPFDFKRCIRLIENKVIDPGFIVSKYYPLTNLHEALSEAVKGHESKIVVTISE
ncbi:alcohol dehydrogenase catalytic domain-containing protein [uncultured Draconibacterium sp.]|uniref:zinc-dependent alcohol dehydrogenase n=1 Tax=uncultured Draconibacterium sp. TaxID=1573823 RepID=UPI0025E8CAB2|nr:alcohol dehydrogenase catalytic domain-containing protein [uncultured Draconibacterium sp.]